MSEPENRENLPENAPETAPEVTPETAPSAETRQPSRAKKRVAMRGWVKTLIRTVIIVIVCVLVLGLAVFGWPGQSQDGFTGLLPILARNATAMEVAGEKIPVCEFNFNYMTTVQYFMQNNSDYLSQLGLEGGTLDALPCYYDPSMTWQDFFVGDTVQTLTSEVLLAQRAPELGITLSEENQYNIDTFINETLPQRAAENGLTVSQFTSKVFGRTVTAKNIAKTLERAYLAQQVSEALTLDGTYSDEERRAYAEANIEDFEVVNFNFYVFLPASEEAEDVVAAKDLAREFLAGVTDTDSFDRQAYAYASEEDKEYYAKAGATYSSNVYRAGVLLNDMAVWLFDEARQTGDKTVIYDADSKAVYALRFDSTGYDESPSYNIRSISFTVPEDDTDASATQQKAQEVVTKWLQAGQTEEAFGELAKEYSEDLSSRANGGLAEKVVPNQMTSIVMSWFEGGRDAGEYVVLSSDTAVYILYVVSPDEPNWCVLADRGISSDKLTDELSEQMAGLSADVTWLGEYLLTK